MSHKIDGMNMNQKIRLGSYIVKDDKTILQVEMFIDDRTLHVVGLIIIKETFMVNKTTVHHWPNNNKIDNIREQHEQQQVQTSISKMIKSPNIEIGDTIICIFHPVQVIDHTLFVIEKSVQIFAFVSIENNYMN